MTGGRNSSASLPTLVIRTRRAWTPAPGLTLPKLSSAGRDLDGGPADRTTGKCDAALPGASADQKPAAARFDGRGCEPHVEDALGAGSEIDVGAMALDTECAAALERHLPDVERHVADVAQAHRLRSASGPHFLLSEVEIAGAHVEPQRGVPLAGERNRSRTAACIVVDHQRRASGRGCGAVRGEGRSRTLRRVRSPLPCSLRERSENQRRPRSQPRSPSVVLSRRCAKSLGGPLCRPRFRRRRNRRTAETAGLPTSRSRGRERQRGRAPRSPALESRPSRRAHRRRPA